MLDHAYLVLRGPQFSDMCVVHGGAPGADQVAHEWYEEHKGVRQLDEDVFPAEWEMYGKSAGPRRNKQMVKAGAHLCLGFPLAGSRGTRNCISLARRAGIPFIEIRGPVASVERGNAAPKGA